MEYISKIRYKPNSIIGGFLTNSLLSPLENLEEHTHFRFHLSTKCCFAGFVNVRMLTGQFKPWGFYFVCV